MNKEDLLKPALGSWRELDEKLGEYAGMINERDRISIKLKAQIQKLQGALQESTADLDSKIHQAEQTMNIFVMANLEMARLEKKKSMVLTNGTVQTKAIPTLDYPDNETHVPIFAALKLNPGLNFDIHGRGIKNIIFDDIGYEPPMPRSQMPQFILNRIIVDHIEQPRKYHTGFIVFLLAVIVFCGLVIVLRGQVAPMRPAPMAIKNQPAVPGIPPAKKPEPQLTMQHIFAQMIVESHGDHGAISSKGCVGSMQVMPATAAERGISEWELHHPVLGLDAGIRIMKDLWARWRMIGKPELRWALSLASYNCGHWRAKQFYYGMILRRAGIRARWFRFLPQETLVYIQKIKANFGGVQK